MIDYIEYSLRYIHIYYILYTIYRILSIYKHILCIFKNIYKTITMPLKHMNTAALEKIQ